MIAHWQATGFVHGVMGSWRLMTSTGLQTHQIQKHYAQKYDELMSERPGLNFNLTNVQNRLPSCQVGDFVACKTDLTLEDLKSKSSD
ncbi:hypothetical protein CONCODRAFT_3885 [Conidiobolus coronatus NRRL 28638]|uniref:Uncharacterized protein n=1 Tax=Conidiobolus coronatus (strain ATCC 28846 / CBS 209.66 / NRRL 28638) TaxID=796925 RepID=A0A137PDY2_CONC2|nr:hypothetical protein CONCODRAFT_3885 [Conidiobolus coronatus NRRL 28638]|eukprot:KXN73214.1 hypothetical protein CONCODRAFT_3885 [Conidiobolus coronatus NRRL 28638]